MMINLKHSDVIWSYLGLILYTLVNILLFPFVLRFLSKNELGLWYTFSSLNALALLFDFGCSVTLSRNITLAWSGAVELKREGIADHTTGVVNQPLFIRLFRISSVLYLLISVVLLLCFLPLGTLYILSITNQIMPITEVLLSWFCYLLAMAISMYFSRYTPILKGIGAIKQTQQIYVVVKLVQFLCSFILLLCGFGLISLSIAYLSSALLSGFLSRYRLLKYDKIGQMIHVYRHTHFSRNEQAQLIQRLLPNTFRQGTLALTDFLVSRASILLISGYLGLGVSASFGLLQQITTILTSVANVLHNTYLPLFGQCRLTQDHQQSQTLLARSTVVQWCILITGGVCVLLCGNYLLQLIGSSSLLPSFGITALYFIYSFLLNNHVLFGSYIIVGNRFPMYPSYLICGGATIVLQWIGIQFLQMDIMGLILIGGCIQLCYNNWNWPKMALLELNCTPKEFIKSIVKRKDK